MIEKREGKSALSRIVGLPLSPSVGERIFCFSDLIFFYKPQQAIKRLI
jgi:hypothetical protein